MTEWLNVGKIVNTHGVRGEVRVISRTDFPEERYEIGNKLYLFKDDEPVALTVSSHRKHKQFNLLTFEGYHNINDVVHMKEGILKVKEDQGGKLGKEEFYYRDIIGLEVHTEDGEYLGKVKEILSPGANDVWVVQSVNGGKDLLLPYIEQVVKNVDLDNGRITVHLMEGLRD
ncbi:ribosome maturation factor RimM [Guptibacillus hwajinpoensis]|uniref:Ribosome maturation factor RimM n=1 Tax=Guptibacillus hwajinpoensis TaxID=208199 RepID=A0A0J6D350_9BACL|nr:ribosome maturation factor RimM [Alkalihalobacillus macyae]KMM38699.1 16S rRNA processing protein RimM [Alkalihalobacillus macyae]